jgi:hypothetical protein
MKMKKWLNLLLQVLLKGKELGLFRKKGAPTDEKRP